MIEYTKICRLSDLTEKRGKRFIIDEVDVAVFLVDGRVYALNNICPHQHAAVMWEGHIDGNTVYCPSHAWQFDLKTGILVDGIKGLDTYEVKIENGDVFAKIVKKELKWDW